MDVRTPVSTNFGDWIERFGEAWRNQIERLKEKFSDSIEEIYFPQESQTEVPVVYVKLEAVPSVLAFMKEDPEFEYQFLADVTATDETPREPRFDLIYQLFSVTRLWRMRLKAKVREGEEAPTVTHLWAGANWPEREVYDMFGIQFKNHPDLRRILMDERWEGYPLRKDYPLKGYQIFSTPEPIHPKLLE